MKFNDPYIHLESLNNKPNFVLFLLNFFNPPSHSSPISFIISYQTPENLPTLIIIKPKKCCGWKTHAKVKIYQHLLEFLCYVKNQEKSSLQSRCSTWDQE